MFRFSHTLILLFAIGFAFGLAGCSHKKTNRGHLFRCDWAFEYNRTPWVGCPPNAGCDDENSCSIEGCEKCSSGKKGLLDCFKKGSDQHCSCEGHKQNKGFRRHCGLNPECTAKNPCCRTLGCGMWIDPADPNSFAGIGNGAKACGLTPFCSPMKPCGLTPNCGRAANPNYLNQQMLMLGNNGMVLSGTATAPSTTMPSAMPSNTPALPMPIPPKKTIETPSIPSLPAQPNPKTPVLAGPNGLLISMGIVPGVSTITTGGVVAAAGVTTPVGIMTPSGVRLPNGVVNNAAVIKVCAMHPGCTATRPCGLTPGCGMMVPVAMVSNNAVQLASALQSPGTAGGIMQAGGMSGVAANNRFAYPMMNQPMNGLSMSGFPQTGYPPIGYAPTGYSRHSGLAAEAGLINTEETIKEENEEEEETQPDETEADIKSSMPVPRFHPVPTKPVFQRSEGLPVTPRTGNGKKTTPSAKTAAKTTSINLKNSNINLKDSKRLFSDEALNEAMEQAYLEGMAAAMEEVEEELDMRSEELTAQSEESEKTKMQEKILEQAQKLQIKIERQKELELQVRQDSLRKEAQRIAAQTAEEQAIREQEIREETEREMAIREQAIRNEAAKEIAVQKQMIRDEAAREMAAQEQAMQAQLAQQNQRWESARIQQALMTQPQISAPQTVQPVNYNNYNVNPATGGGRKMIASAFGFLKGNGQRMTSPMNQLPINQPMNPQTVTNRIRSPNMGQPVRTPNNVTSQYAGYAAAPTRQMQQTTPQTMSFNGMPNNNTVNNSPISGFGFLQSAKSTGTNLLSAVGGVISPFSGLLGSDTPNARPPIPAAPRSTPIDQSIVQNIPTSRNIPMTQQIPSSRSVPVAQQTVHNTRQTDLSSQSVPQISATPTKIPIPQLTGNSSLRYCPDCGEPFPEHNSSVLHTKSATMNKRVPLSVSSKISAEESDILVPELPQKPPTKSKTITKPKRTIEVDDEETSMIRQANFVE
ncbi:MAG: trichohyalin-plectin-homology domain domain-containing protein [Planctomycetaceae bacterium]|nr:trichohyalin-plectin-homology domain domain-containing protein [Planctomycetaceae bacterium]